MASKTFITIALFLAVNILMFNLAAAQTCSVGDIKIEACANVLNLVNLTIGKSALEPCCSLITGLVNLEAEVCVCQSVKASVLGIVNATVNVDLVLRLCGVTPSTGFACV